jgi:hypothetical protein
MVISLFILSIYLIIGFCIYKYEENLIEEEKLDELELYEELDNNERILFFIFTVLFWFPILVLHWFGNFFGEKTE